MRPVVAELVPVTELLQTIGSALVAAVGITAAFSIAIYGVTRFADLNREQRPLVAGLAGLLAAIALIVCLAGIVLGIIVTTSK